MNQSANDITANLLIEIPKRFPGARAWRRNVGKAVGWDTVERAIRMLLAGQIKAAIDLLRSRPIRFGMPGEADIDGVMPPHGRRLAIEVKAGKDQMSEEQIAFREMILRNGGIHVIARDVDQALAELQEQLNTRSHT